MNRFRLTIMGVLTCMHLQCMPADDVVIIVNRANTAVVDKALVARIYTGEVKLWAGGATIVALDLPEDNSERAQFSSLYVGKSVTKLRLLWMQNIYAGKATPPKIVNSDDEVKKMVAANKDAIGYISASHLDATVSAVGR